VGLADIAANAEGAISGVLNAFGKSGTPPYPKALGESVSNIIIENDKSWRKSLGYVFKVVRVAKDGSVNESPDDWLEFVLQINPQELDQDEIFAIEVTPTFAGVLVEHQGTTLKDISISGTTGISPMRRAGGAFPQSGRAVMSAGRSGYMEFHELRTYIRAYVEQKRSDPDRAKGELRLVWRNLRDHEDLYVEPQRFSMKRQAGKAFLYNYVFTMKAIGIANLSPPDKGFLALIDGAIEDITDALQAAAQVIAGAFDFVKLVDENIENTILGPVNAVAQGIAAFKTGKANQKSFGALVKGLKKKINNNLNVAKSLGNDAEKQKKLKAEKASQLSVAVKDAQSQQFAAKTLTALQVQKLKDNVATVTNNILAKLAAQSVANAASYEQLQVLNALKQTKVACDKALQTATLFADTSKKQADVINTVFAAKAANAATAAASAILKKKVDALAKATKAGDTITAAKVQAEIKEINTAKAQAAAKSQAVQAQAVSTSAKMAKTIDIDGGMTIQALAAKEMGSPLKFKDIAFYNGLKPPYIDTTPLDIDPVRVPGVLRPGDKILIPQEGSSKTTFNTVTKSSEPPIVSALSAAEKNFGVDFQLTDEYDLAISNTGDVKLVAGSANIGQRVAIKLLLDPGSLKYHLEIGVGLKVGERLQDDLDKMIGRVRRSLSADNAIESVIYAGADQAGPVLNLNMILKLKNVDQPLAVPVKVA